MSLRVPSGAEDTRSTALRSAPTSQPELSPAVILLTFTGAAVAAAVWWLLSHPAPGALRADQVALLALLLAASGYAIAALAAWRCARASHREEA